MTLSCSAADLIQHPAKIGALCHVRKINTFTFNLSSCRNYIPADMFWEEFDMFYKDSTKVLTIALLLSPFSFGSNGTKKLTGAYEVQDAVYCYPSKGSIDIGATKVTDPVFKIFLEDQSELYKKQKLFSTTTSKMLYENAFARWRIRQPDGIDLNDECADYVKLERSVAENMDPLYFVVSLIPCAKLWPWLGQQITLQPHNFGVYASWVAENLNPHDEGYKLLDQVIDNGFTLGLINKKCALEIYMGCMTGEAQFFSSVTP